ncbi:homoserine kinase [Occallatibacter riparius]|uniref:Homoserine kinase n=1 Tax=Occallatibacter riparius TaxID=1002689 RepID=A0A9J7BKA3_9BACT|nr:homoserine kinase [Occallatibacter riparius]UWZ83003.1 homoserine kinase [Occallatibacter riparius]
MSQTADRIRVRLPATSANLGPGFDTAAVALDFHLTVEAEPAAAFSIAATGRDAERCGALEDNLVIELYRTLLEREGRPATPLAIRMENEIPLGMGCGSSAAGRLAAIVLANHFGSLGWSSDRVLAEASELEGHPDNAAACWLGGFVASGTQGGEVHVARVTPPEDWRAIVVLPTEPLATSKARAVLPAIYARTDVVINLQGVAMLGLAFAQGRGELLKAAMTDRVHQPYRSAICPQLPKLLPLAGQEGILGVALSGAGPAVLAIVNGERSVAGAFRVIFDAMQEIQRPELLLCRFESQGTVVETGVHA